MSTSRFASLSLALLFVLGVVSAQTDPGVQSASRGTGATIIDPSNDPNGFTAFFNDGLNRLQEVETVSSSANTGLGPRFSSNQCKGDQRCAGAMEVQTVRQRWEAGSGNRNPVGSNTAHYRAAGGGISGPLATFV